MAAAGLAPELYRRAWHRAVRAKHAAIAVLRLQLSAARCAVIEKETGIGRHRFRFGVAALRARQYRLENKFRHRDSGRRITMVRDSISLAPHFEHCNRAAQSGPGVSAAQPDIRAGNALPSTAQRCRRARPAPWPPG